MGLKVCPAKYRIGDPQQLQDLPGQKANAVMYIAVMLGPIATIDAGPVGGPFCARGKSGVSRTLRHAIQLSNDILKCLSNEKSYIDDSEPMRSLGPR
jgi:hypothetical protein